jgi:hypothetical protein
MKAISSELGSLRAVPEIANLPVIIHARDNKQG